MNGSNVPAVKTELVTRLTARAALSGVQVSYGQPVRVLDVTALWFGDADSTFEAIAFKKSAGRIEVEEDAEITCYMQAIGYDTQVAADTETAMMLGELFDEVMSNPTLDGNVSGLLAILPLSGDRIGAPLPNSSKYASIITATLGMSSLIQLA